RAEAQLADRAALAPGAQHGVAEARLLQPALHGRDDVTLRQLADLARTLRRADLRQVQLLDGGNRRDEFVGALFGEVDEEAPPLVVPADDVDGREDDVLRRPRLHLQKVDQRQRRLRASLETV